MRDLAELGLISIEEEKNGLPASKKQIPKKALIDHGGVEKSESIQEEKFNFDDLPPIIKSLAGSLKAPDDEFGYKKFKSDRSVIKYP